MIFHDINRGVKRLKTKTNLITSALAVGTTSLGLAVAIPIVAHADSNNIDFENPPYIVGSISGQDGWSNAVNPTYDQGVVSTSVPGFGSQAFRISDAVTSGSFGDWVFAKPLINSVGETASTASTFSAGTKQGHFEMQFDIASTVPDGQQPGLHISVSPDRGDGSRMSYLRFEDGASGINVFFDDVQGTTNPANFVETQIATGLNRAIPHTVKLTMDTLDGSSNDVVKVWIDGVLVHTGTSWENYYRFDTEAAAEQSPRIVKTVIIQARGTATPGNNTFGFLFDNLSLKSGPIVNVPTDKNQCKNNGWKNFTNNNGKPFKNQGDCVSFVNSSHKNINNVNINNNNHQTATTGNAHVNGNTTGGNATSGDALNRNSTTNNVNINNL
ncbi:hypothetical protein COU91_00970 [Candidatus Saccharibacteria bacterium CG10_big_fil_rev_8_21_14_0_10_47_8]|nr:MAG: hypothetical protein COU91_00970 [Candidatus Saccharibacteria bacterium CG10_big_fil_rev_8_21_14_0_10_47_8]